ncbi:hypothetical protein COY14_02435 [Candidatus Roizmanbacteria bacterium CG_4_10_14_0_2_um_filter_36_9]|uniref:Uncharacterized protein n=2 Tax=Candidatus Roizmaniibacteriota TaxID=1752723 RepID=A0A2M7U4A9_9BACT|nr:MAG: hypothetical protein COY14_02435 [Candidatus Roizmanbacteria bacterium CG_4_10_14_0_2_um_filter_36_9]
METVDEFEHLAIEAAANADWLEAIKQNKRIIKIEKDNLFAHLRLGFALMQQNNLVAAKKAYQVVLKLQPKNNIAEEHLEKISILSEKNKKRNNTTFKFNPDLFIDIPGKTRTVHLVNLGHKEDLAGISIGEEVIMKEKRRKLEVRTQNDEYIGFLPDDISKRLTYFINEKSLYSAHIKEVGLLDVAIFIRELSKGQKVRLYPSFPSNPHVMLSDIQQIESAEEPDDLDKDDDEDELVEGGLALDDEKWQEYQEGRDLERIVELEDDEEEEE